MSEILFLAHRIPYPPDKGDKIRSYHLLRALAARHDVHLGTLVDDEADWIHVDALKRMCAECCIRPLRPRRARFRSARALLAGGPLTMAYYRDRGLWHWARDLAARRPLAGVFAFSSSMGQYVDGLRLQRSAVRVIDFCDVDSDKWRQYADSQAFPLNLVYAREARLLARAETQYVREFEATLVVSEVEARLLQGPAADEEGRVHIVPNGVDADYYDPSVPRATPFALGTRPVVFTGAMDYHANVDGVRWFVRDILPAVRRQLPDVVFAIVGSNPAPAVLALAHEPGVVVTGRVPDVRPYLAHAQVVVAPLRLARGVQNKVLEAMAMARPVVATANALQGVPQADVGGVRTTSDAATMAQFVVELATRREIAWDSRQFVLERYAWSKNLAPVNAFFEGARAVETRVNTASARTA